MYTPIVIPHANNSTTLDSAIDALLKEQATLDYNSCQEQIRNISPKSQQEIDATNNLTLVIIGSVVLISAIFIYFSIKYKSIYE